MDGPWVGKIWTAVGIRPKGETLGGSGVGRGQGPKSGAAPSPSQNTQVRGPPGVQMGPLGIPLGPLGKKIGKKNGGFTAGRDGRAGHTDFVPQGPQGDSQGPHLDPRGYPDLGVLAWVRCRP